MLHLAYGFNSGAGRPWDCAAFTALMASRIRSWPALLVPHFQHAMDASSESQHEPYVTYGKRTMPIHEQCNIKKQARSQANTLMTAKHAHS